MILKNNKEKTAIAVCIYKSGGVELLEGRNGEVIKNLKKTRITFDLLVIIYSTGNKNSI